MSESIRMTRSEVDEAMARFFANGGKVTKLPDVFGKTKNPKD